MELLNRLEKYSNVFKRICFVYIVTDRRIFQIKDGIFLKIHTLWNVKFCV